MLKDELFMGRKTNWSHCARIAFILLCSGTAPLAALASTDAAFSIQAVVPASAPKTCGIDWVGLIRALAWPAAIGVLAVCFRQPLADFVVGVSSRINKLQIAQLSIELAGVSQSERKAPSLDEIRALTSAQVGDSSRILFGQAQSTEPADFAVVNLGQGKDWLTTRLFIAAAIMERMRGTQVFVFVEDKGDNSHVFVAVVQLRRLRWLLARRYPWLEIAFQTALSNLINGRNPHFDNSPFIVSENGGLDPYQAGRLVEDFIASLQSFRIPGAAIPDGWEGLDETRLERAGWVDKKLLASLLGATAPEFDNFVVRRDGVSSAKFSRSVLRRKAPFVAVVDEKDRFRELIDRGAFVEMVAAQAGEEPD